MNSSQRNLPYHKLQQGTRRARVGRVNRVDTRFDTIFTYNFFPTEQSNDLLKLKEAAEAKIQAAGGRAEVIRSV